MQDPKILKGEKSKKPPHSQKRPYTPHPLPPRPARSDPARMSRLSSPPSSNITDESTDPQLRRESMPTTSLRRSSHIRHSPSFYSEAKTSLKLSGFLFWLYASEPTATKHDGRPVRRAFITISLKSQTVNPKTAYDEHNPQ